ncbi:MAG: bifunctional protein-serine/threonine kinase/phosphatase, partial [Ramlibacter sp.]
MPAQLKVSTGQYSDKGRKETNQDFHGICIPPETQLASKGIAIALADGISSSGVSQVASQYAVSGFLEDYYCTSEAWSVKTSAERILRATNAWLHAQTQRSPWRYDKDKGYVCTLSAMVIKSHTAHIFHVGDSRIYRVNGNALEQLTTDHRVWVGQGQSYLSHALGINPQLEIDYQSLQVEEGDVFVLATDGVYEHASGKFIIEAVRASHDDLDEAAKKVVQEALHQGSTDNLTIQLVRVDQLPNKEAGEIHRQLSGLPFPPILEPRAVFDGYTIVRELHGSSRSHIYLAIDTETSVPVSIKAPSIDLQDDAAYLERFLTEEWIARRIDSAHVLRPFPPGRKRNFVYVVNEFIEGQTLSQWMIDNPRPGLEAVRGIVEQVARGLMAFHRLEMLHQDLRPDNIMIDRTGTVRIIDFGSTRVAGIMEGEAAGAPSDILGTAQYTAPEYFLGEGGSPRSDIFSLGVITYQMLTGRLPYGARVASSRTRAAQNSLVYDSVLEDEREIPAWIDEVLRKAVHPDPRKRYEEVSEFAYDLRHPSTAFLARVRPALIERNPLLFWKGLCLVLA